MPRGHPKLRVVEEREGLPGRRPVEPTLKLPAAIPNEPDWKAIFPGRTEIPELDEELAKAALRCRRNASACWRRITKQLEPYFVLADLDWVGLQEVAVCYARLLECERDLSIHGTTVTQRGGSVMNRNVTAATGYRVQLRGLMAEYGLTPLARDRLAPRDPGAGDDDFD